MCYYKPMKNTTDTKTTDAELKAKEAKEAEDAKAKEEEELAKSKITTKSAKIAVTHFAVYENGIIIKIFNHITHGDDFIEIAEAMANRLAEKNGTLVEAKEYVNEIDPEVDPNIATVVNASNSVIRIFSLSTHGKKYQEIAESYIEKHGVKRGYRLI